MSNDVVALQELLHAHLRAPTEEDVRAALTDGRRARRRRRVAVVLMSTAGVAVVAATVGVVVAITRPAEHRRTLALETDGCSSVNGLELITKPSNGQGSAITVLKSADSCHPVDVRLQYSTGDGTWTDASPGLYDGGLTESPDVPITPDGQAAVYLSWTASTACKDSPTVSLLVDGSRVGLELPGWCSGASLTMSPIVRRSEQPGWTNLRFG